MTNDLDDLDDIAEQMSSRQNTGYLQRNNQIDEAMNPSEQRQ